MSRRRGTLSKKTSDRSWSNQEWIEARLAEVSVGRERIAKPELLHDPKAKAIGEGPSLNMMLQKELSRLRGAR
jgi:hypothetical protein